MKENIYFHASPLCFQLYLFGWSQDDVIVWSARRGRSFGESVYRSVSTWSRGTGSWVNWLVCDTWFSQSKYHLEVTRQGSHVSAMVWPKNTLPVPLIIFLFIFFVNNSLVLLISESLYRVPPWYLLCLVRCCIVRNKRRLLQFAMYSFSSIYVDVCLFYRVKHTWH